MLLRSHVVLLLVDLPDTPRSSAWGLQILWTQPDFHAAQGRQRAVWHTSSGKALSLSGTLDILIRTTAKEQVGSPVLNWIPIRYIDSPAGQAFSPRLRLDLAWLQRLMRVSSHQAQPQQQGEKAGHMQANPVLGKHSRRQCRDSTCLPILVAYRPPSMPPKAPVKYSIPKACPRVAGL